MIAMTIALIWFWVIGVFLANEVVDRRVYWKETRLFFAHWSVCIYWPVTVPIAIILWWIGERK